MRKLHRRRIFWPAFVTLWLIAIVLDLISGGTVRSWLAPLLALASAGLWWWTR